MNVTLFLFGWRRVVTDRAHTAALLDLCLAGGLAISDLVPLPDGGVSFRLRPGAARRLARTCHAKSVPLRVEKGGLPTRVSRLRGRLGLLLGAICATFLFILARQFVWSVRVVGNERIPAGEIRAMLAAQGLEIGSYLPSVRAGEVETGLLLASSDLAWVAVRTDGTVATVQVVEREPEDGKKDRPANLVAARDGQIEGLELYRGQAVVSVGQAVRAGELLVSGVYDSATVGWRYTRASGRVMARTERVLRVEVPLTYEKKVPLKAERRETVLRFFKFSLKFSKNSRNEAPLCDIIEKTTGNDWLGMRELPVSLVRRTYLPYELTTATRSPEEALDLAYAGLERRLADLSPGAQLLGKRIVTEITDTALVLICTVECVENIAVQAEFDVVG